eukprot:TRINITY_DN2807_c0_g1_i1.p1 TRINITY_DN2807_c0_g1~~TRINITY_DN2807_c0_g1_i1.p1  ORF type:complete len:1012 (-),score=272.84 TRINITY_DN2807_c0_g1_i1:103-3138(-)
MSGLSGSADDQIPPLNYQKFISRDLFSKSNITTLTTFVDYVAIGNEKGEVHMFDLSGKQIGAFCPHSSRVNGIEVNSSGDWIATCSDDESVSLTNLMGSSHESLIFNLERPLLAIALDSTVDKRPSFVTGGLAGKLIFNKKLWFKTQHEVIHEREGPIHASAWKGNLIAWANGVGVKVYDINSQQRISFVEKPKSVNDVKREKCFLSWENEQTLLIGWGNSVQVLQILPNSNTTSGTTGAGFSVSITSAICLGDTDTICGLCPFGQDIAVLVHCIKEDGSNDFPQLQLLDRFYGELISCDTLPLSTSSTSSSSGTSENPKCDLNPQDLVLGCHLESAASHPDRVPVMFIATPNEVIVAKPLTVDDYVSWALEKGDFEEALEIVHSFGSLLENHCAQDLHELYIGHLLKEGRCNDAANACVKLLPTEVEVWERWVLKFYEDHGKSGREAIFPVIPIGNPRLSQSTYQLALGYLMRDNPQLFLQTLRHWYAVDEQKRLFDPLDILKRLESTLSASGITRALGSNRLFLQVSLAELCDATGQFERALEVLLKMIASDVRAKELDGFDQTVFALIQSHKLVKSLENNMLQLFKINVESTVQLLLDFEQQIGIAQVTDELKSQMEKGKPKSDEFMFVYLSELLKRPSLSTHFNQAKYKSIHKLAVELFVERSPQELLSFLKSNDHYPLEHTRHLCSKHQLHNEEIYVLDRMGRSSEALNLAIKELENADVALRFVGEHEGDTRLQKQLIQVGMKHSPKFATRLLQLAPDTAWMKADEMIKLIDSSWHIPHSKSLIQSILFRQKITSRQLDGCLDLLNEDTMSLQHTARFNRSCGVHVSGSAKCCYCKKALSSVMDKSLQRDAHYLRLANSNSPCAQYIPQSIKRSVRRRPMGRFSIPPPLPPPNPNVKAQPAPPMKTSNACIAFKCGHHYHEKCLQEAYTINKLPQIQSNERSSAERLFAKQTLMRDSTDGSDDEESFYGGKNRPRLDSLNMNDPNPACLICNHEEVEELRLMYGQ